MKVKRLLKSIIAICLICCILPLSAVYAEDAPVEGAQQEPETVNVVVMASSLKKGAKIKASNVKLVTLKNVNLPKNTISNAEDVVGKYAAEYLHEGEFVRPNQLLDRKQLSDDQSLPIKPISKSFEDYVIVTEYVLPNTGKDITTHLQKIIDCNPQKTIYFPDGEYIISRSLLTPSDPRRSVMLHFSDGAVLKASSSWEATETLNFDEDFNALVCIGGAGDKVNDTAMYGSYHGIFGGTFDGNNRADGLAFVWARESIIRNVHIKNAKVGISVQKGANGVSSDKDVDDVIIEGTGAPGSIGIKMPGYDNTISNVRIYDVQTGVIVSGGGNVLREVHCYYTHSEKLNELDKKYASTIGFQEVGNGNFFFSCYAENYATGFKFNGNRTIVDSCRAGWTSSEGGRQTAFATSGAFNIALSNCVARFFNGSTENKFLSAAKSGSGRIEAPMFDPGICKETTYKKYLRTAVVPLSN